MSKTFHIYSPRTVAILKRLNAMGPAARAGDLCLAYDETERPRTPFLVRKDPGNGAIQTIGYFPSEEALRENLGQWLADAGGELPATGGRKPSDDAMENVTIRMNAAQREAVETNGRDWVRGLIDEALRQESWRSGDYVFFPVDGPTCIVAGVPMNEYRAEKDEPDGRRQYFMVFMAPDGATRKEIEACFFKRSKS